MIQCILDALGHIWKKLVILCYIFVQWTFKKPKYRHVRSIFGVLSGDMLKQRLFIALAAFFLFTNAIAKADDNPFEKGVSVDIGRNAEWVINDKAATRSGSDDGLFYHLFYDKKQLRLRITETAEDSETTSKHYEQFAVNDILLDGERLPVFQWCLNNQERHKRFLQQGLQVNKDVCKNQGEIGTFTIRLNVATLEALGKGKKLTFHLKPFRLPVDVNFDISDFSDVIAKLNASDAPVVAKPGVTTAPVAAVEKKCNASPPTGFVEVKAVEYDCADAAARAKATASVDEAVSKERERRKQVAAEQERKRLETEAAKKAQQDKLAAEQAAIAASAAQQAAINDEISTKMIAVCKKKWEQGEHRCYCEKYIEHAPEEIKKSSTCSGS